MSRKKSLNEMCSLEQFILHLHLSNGPLPCNIHIVWNLLSFLFQNPSGLQAIDSDHLCAGWGDWFPN